MATIEQPKTDGTSAAKSKVFRNFIDGEWVASASGSQIGPQASGAGQVIFAVGAQKVVPDLETALRRVYEYAYVLEDERAQKAYGIHSAVNEILVISGDWLGRITVILIDEALGF